jgi:hypothetical protein
MATAPWHVRGVPGSTAMLDRANLRARILVGGLALVGACGGGGAGGVDASTVPDASGAVDATPLPPIDCATMELLAPGYELAPIETSFDAGAPPRGPSATPRDIAARRVYVRTAVAQYGGPPDERPPAPTLIAFEFEPDSQQLTGSYCVVQATFDERGVATHGHYPLSFVPRSPGGTDDDWYVIATLGDGSFPIGFDGTAEELTIYVTAGPRAYLESYVAVPAR